MSTEPSSPWWREPMVWLLIALPSSAVVGGLITWRIAAQGADPLVAEDYYKQGMVIHQTLEKEARAAALGLTAEIEAQAGVLRVRLYGRLDAYPDRLRLELIHPSRQEEDRLLYPTATAQGKYQVALPSMPPGGRRIVLEDERATWRLTGRTQVPLGFVRLVSTGEASTPAHDS